VATRQKYQLKFERRASRTASVIYIALVLLFAIGGALAFGEGNPESADVFTPLVDENEASRVQPDTDPTLALALPHEDLDRAEAEELLQGVFAEELEVSAQFFDDLEVEAFRSDHVAVVNPPSPSQSAGLLSSSLPLRAEGASGEKELIDLGLEAKGGHLEPENPLVDVAIPVELSEGILIPAAGVSIDLPTVAGDRQASEVGEATAFFPNVRADTDVAITATPAGVETYTHLRSPDAPRQEVFDLGIPAGSELLPTASGGARVIDAGGETSLLVQPPWAIDAEGEQVGSHLAVEGNSIIVSVDPPADASYPILVDPIFESYNFNGQSSPGTTGKDWSGASNQGFGYSWGSYPNYGMTVQAFGGAATSPGNQAIFNYYVPRYWTDIQAGLPKPLSYIRNMKLWNLTYMMPSESGLAQTRPAYPFMQLGLWDENSNQFVWSVQRYGNEGQLTDGNYVFNMTNPNDNPDVKHGGFAMATFDSWNSAWRYVNVQQASVEVTETDAPGWQFMLNPSGWMNQTAKPLEYSVSDYGLGIHSLRVAQPSASGGTGVITTSNGCIGTASNACPRTTSDSSRKINYDPQAMAQGENTVSVTALDPVQNQSAPRLVKFKIDHSAPGLSLSGNLTEQGTVGTNLQEYTLGYAASDGDDAAAAAQTPISTQGVGAGQLERPVGMAIDAEGDIWTADRIRKKIVQFDKNGKLLSEFGTPGTGDGQLGDMRGLAIAQNGNIWVAEAGTRAAQQFTPSGTFVSKIVNSEFLGVYGIAIGPDGVIWLADQERMRVYQYKADGTKIRSIGSPFGTGVVPTGIDVDSYGNAWVTVQGWNQVVELSPTGAVLSKFGSGGTGNGQFQFPQGVSIAPSGNVFVVDDTSSRVQVFKPDGMLLRQFGTSGAGSNQFKEPREVVVGPGNIAYVSDAGNHRIARWGHADQDPQSGATKVEMKVDGVTKATNAPGCTSKNCTVNGSWVLKADDYAGGPHKVEVVATDGVALQTTKTLNIQTHGDFQPPSIVLSGNMTQQASQGTTLPSYKLKVSATDSGSAEERKSGVASSVIKVDGIVVDSVAPGCTSGGCSITREWTLNSSSYSVGSHKVEVIATDVAGKSTTKTLTINIARDTTAPTFDFLEWFYSTPSGWLEQKKYEYGVIAGDKNGYGVTSLQLKIDGSVVKSAAGACTAGNCTRYFGFEETIAMSSYSGGAHLAELVATDGAGNTRKRSWTLNVDPNGHILVGEATDTLEAVEETAPQITEDSPVDGLVTGMVGEGGLNPQLVSSGDVLVSSGSPTPSTVSLDPADGFAIETTAANSQGVVRQENLEVVPVTLGQEAGAATPTDGSAAVIPNSSVNVDTILRPAYDGLMAFNAIRATDSPKTFSWEVRLGEDEALQLLDDRHAAVVWNDGTQAMLLVAQLAHDADGKEVPTTLSVSGNVITLTVHHDTAGVVYPVVAGVGYEGGFQYVEGEKPAPTEQGEWESDQIRATPPKLLPYDNRDSDEATASTASRSLPHYSIEYEYDHCAYEGYKGCYPFKLTLTTRFEYNHRYVWWKESKPHPRCERSTHGFSASLEFCNWVGQNHQPNYGGYHITSRGVWAIAPLGGPVEKEEPVSIYMYPSGYANGHNTDCICNPSN
jgi:DNA-binding beta-propeller fold protein YncE